jgi:hypothetical protein
MTRPTPSTLSLATRFTAALGAALVLVLTILAVPRSPRLRPTRATMIPAVL